jgi:heptosyltransferase I
MLKGLSGVDFIVIDKPKRPADYLALRKRFKPYSFDVLIAAQASLRANLIFPFIPAKRKIGFDSRRGRELHRCFVSEQVLYRDEHLAEGFMGFARALGISTPERVDYQWGLPLSDDDRQWAVQQRRTKRMIAINPAASKAERTWPTERYIELVQQLTDQYHCQIVLTGGPAKNELEIAAAIEAAIEAAVGDKVTNLVGKTSYGQMTALMGEVDCLIAPDTGPVHIAVAMGTPVIGLYAVARPELSGPYQAREELCVNRYPEAVSLCLNKSVDEAGWHERVHDARAMALITVDDVTQRVPLILSGDC